MLILRMLIWPLAVGLGFAFVIWFYDLTDSTRTWREVDEAMSLSLVAWFAGPALTWVLVPRAWGRPSWIIWTLACGGVTVFAAILVQLGLFAYSEDLQRYLDFSPSDLLRLFERIGDQSVEKTVWLPGAAALYLGCTAVGYAVGLGMVSRILALAHVAACAVGAAAVYLAHVPLGRLVGDLFVALDWTAALSFAYPMGFAMGAAAGVLGAVAILVWGLAVGPGGDDLEPEGAEPW